MSVGPGEGRKGPDRDGPAATAPHMVMVVANAVVGDSRVEKTAESARRAGYRVTVLGVAERSHHAVDVLGGVPLLRVRPGWQRYSRWQSLLRTGAFDHEPPAAAAALAEERLAARIAARVADGSGRPGRSRPQAPRVAAGGGRRGATLPDTLTRCYRDAGLALAAVVARLPVRGAWRPSFPFIADLEDELLRVLLDLRPDLVHVHDCHPLPAVARYAQIERHVGRRVPWVYDAHEWLPGQSFPGPVVHGLAWQRVELEFARRADAVVTVGDDLARMLQRRHRLRRTPAVVANAPLAGEPVPAPGRRTIREEAGLGPDVPLLVYSGLAAVRRGVQTVVEALRDLPGVHLAVVTAREPGPRAALQAQARALGVEDRLHVLDYVPSEAITWYLASATVGLSPLTHNAAHHSAVPTKVREYLHAGLPVVVSDCRAQQRMVATTAVGEVHRAEDVASFVAAAGRVLDRLDHYRSALTDELLDEQSWQHQDAVLRGVWTRLVAPGPAPGAASTSLVVGPVSARTPELQALGEELARARPGSVRLVTHDAAAQRSGTHLSRSAGSSARSGAALDDLRAVIDADAVLLTATTGLLPGLFATSADEVAALVRNGRAVVVAVAETDVTGPSALSAHGVHVASAGSDADLVSRWERRARRNRRDLERLGVPVLVIGTCAPTSLTQAVLVPAPVAVPATEPPRAEGPLSVRVLPGPQHLYGAATRVLHAAAADGTLRLVEPSEVGQAHVALVPGTGVRGLPVLGAVAAGSLVLAVVEDDVSLPDGPPVEAVRTDALAHRLAELARSAAAGGADERATALRRAQRDWVRGHHRVEVGAEVVAGTLRTAGGTTPGQTQRGTTG